MKATEKFTGKYNPLGKTQCVPLKFRVLLEEEGEEDY